MVRLPIYGFSVEGYRGFKSSRQYVGPLTKINLFIGPNNVGKSNILRFVHEELVRVKAGLTERVVKRNNDPDPYVNNIDNSDRRSYSLGIAVPASSIDDDAAFRSGRQGVNQRRLEHLRESLKSHLTRQDDLAWFEFEFDQDGTRLGLEGNFISRIEGSNLDVSLLQQVIPTSTKYGDRRSATESVLRYFAAKARIEAEAIYLVPAFRKATGEPEAEKASSLLKGTGLIRQLFRLQSPDALDQRDKLRWKAIQEFLSSVAEPQTVLEVPHHQKTLNVNMRGKILPLEALGTGIEEMVILAAAATLVENSIVCIEEPELHLHPLLQRRLLEFLSTKTNNQYFISTHSASILDVSSAAIFRLRLDSGETVVERVRSDADKFSVCTDLGYRASDLLQANCIVWVEGPSDRIYVNAWLGKLDSKLQEGIHFSIMFYGGRLLSHLSASDPEIDGFIALRRLNRNLVVVIDSDKASAEGQINETKQRVIREFEAGPGFAWLTEGRTIENYLERQTLEEAARKVRPKLKRLTYRNKYHAPLAKWVDADGRKQGQSLDKVKIAQRVVENELSLDILDLKKQLRRLVRTIREANGMSIPSE